jgi:tetratricopeptide (TPR) repeat protein
MIVVMPVSIFVLMPFSEEFDDVYLVIKDAVGAAGNGTRVPVVCARADEISSPGRITDQTVRAIAECDLLIADISGSNPNVMYELGYGHALGKPAIILNQDVHGSPFDVKDFRQVLYDRRRLVKDCRPSIVAAVSDVLARSASETVEPAAPLASAATPEPVSAASLRPSPELALSIQALHLKLQVANSKRDRALVSQLAQQVRDTLARVTVTSGGDVSSRSNVAAAVGNCAVEMEKADLVEAAEDVYRRALGLFPDYVGIHVQYADFLADSGRTEEARTELLRATELEPNDPRIQRVELKLATLRGQPLSPVLETSLRADFDAQPQDEQKAVALLYFMIKTGKQPQEVEEVCLRWRTAAADGDKHMADRALADYLAEREEVGSRQRAVELYEDLLASSSTPSEQRQAILHNLATLHAQLGDSDRARSRWSEAYAIDRADPMVKASFSQRLASWGDLDAALAVVEGRPLP